MVRRTRALQEMLAGFSLFLIGAILIACTLSVFSYTRQELEQVPRSEVIIDSLFSLHQFKDKMVQVQLSIGQSLRILAEGNGNFSFSIVNFTKTDGSIQPDQPDLIYFSRNNIAAVNTTWSPQTRVPEPGGYYLVFLARNASSDSPVEVYANANKTWTDIQLKEVVAPDRIPLLDERFGYVGSVLAVAGTVLFSVAFSRSRRPRNRR